jgi:hypothetical protein
LRPDFSHSVCLFSSDVAASVGLGDTIGPVRQNGKVSLRF